MASLLLLNLVISTVVAVYLFAGRSDAVKAKLFQRNEKTNLATEFCKDTAEKEVVPSTSSTWAEFFQTVESDQTYYRVQRFMKKATTEHAGPVDIDKPIHFQYLFHCDPPEVVAVLAYVPGTKIRPVVAGGLVWNTTPITFKIGAHKYDVRVAFGRDQPMVELDE